MALADVGPLPRVDIFVLGEVYDNPAHHAVQADIVAQLAPAALVFEMLSPQQAAAGQDVARDDAAALAAAFDWARSGWPDFAFYAPLFAAAPDARIVGAAVPRDLILQVMTDGIGAADVFVPDLLPPQLALMEQEQAAVHCDALPVDMLPGMVAAQRLRDATFAMAAIAARDALDGPVVVITGTGHARTDVGVPLAIRAVRPDLTVWALGQIEGAVPLDAPFDAVMTTDPVDRPDPCAAFAG